MIKTQFTFLGSCQIGCGILYICIGIFIAVLALELTRALDKDEIIQCTTFSLADNEFVPVYLGYFFVALSVPNMYALSYVYVMVFALVFMTDAYFNPVFILFGYHYYNVVTAEGSEMFSIVSVKLGVSYIKTEPASIIASAVENGLLWKGVCYGAEGS